MTATEWIEGILVLLILNGVPAIIAIGAIAIKFFFVFLIIKWLIKLFKKEFVNN